MNDLNSFAQSVLHDSFIIYHHLEKGHTFKMVKSESDDEVTQSVNDILEESEKILDNPSILKIICPSLEAISDDLAKICNTIVGILVPLIIAKSIQMPMNSLIFGGMAVLILTRSTKSICSGVKNLKNDK